ncbi:hypothetical protein E4514_01135 [Escherichia coli]|nr:hypothetical protein [Escherichia coli]UMS41188.1 hypothetical protein AOY78_16440 [Escherichia coli]
MTHDKNLHIAPLLLTRFARFLSSETRERKRWPALCLIHSPNETLFFYLNGVSIVNMRLHFEQHSAIQRGFI